MGNRLVYKGMIIGAIVGGAITLLDHDTRKEAIAKLDKTRNKATYYMHHPSLYMGILRTRCEMAANTLVSGMDTTIKMINEMQQMLEVTKDKDIK